MTQLRVSSLGRFCRPMCDGVARRSLFHARVRRVSGLSRLRSPLGTPRIGGKPIMQIATGSVAAESYIRQGERQKRFATASYSARRAYIRACPLLGEDHMRVSIVAAAAAASAGDRLLLKHSAQAGRVNPILTAMTAPCARAAPCGYRRCEERHCCFGEHERSRNDSLHWRYECLCVRV